jgi:hypothetical protein
MRFQLVANIWIALGLAVSLDYWIRNASIAQSWRRKMLAGGVLLFCLFEQINVMNNSSLPRSRELSFLAAVPKPPMECHAFFVDAPRPADYLDQTDAMWISLQAELPTLNGIAGWFPPGWDFIGAVDNLAAGAALACLHASKRASLHLRSLCSPLVIIQIESRGCGQYHAVRAAAAGSIIPIGSGARTDLR